MLPSLPPRQPSEADVVLRQEEPTRPWGASRFSNGRDVNAEFLRAQREGEPYSNMNII